MSETKRWTCEVCGYIHKGDAAPEQCPVCGVDADQFVMSEIEIFQPKAGAGKWKCNVCGYIHEGETPPSSCPVCSVPSEHFTALDAPVAEGSSGSARKLVIIGAGVAGLTAAETAVSAPGTEVVLISKEVQLPYYRLNLTRYLAGEVDAASLVMKSDDWFNEHNVKLVYGDVVHIDRDEKQVELRDGTRHSYDKLVISAGAHCFMPPIPGANREGVFTLRTQKDAEDIIAASKNAAHCVVIGGGLLGLEAAGALKKRGCNVTVLEGYGWLLPRQLPQKGGELLKDVLQQEDIHVVTSATTKELLGDEAVQGILLADGRTIETDMVVVSTGVRANSYLARQCGLTVGNAILVDDQLRTNDPDIYAAGDVCEHRGVLYGIWPASYLQGATAAANALGAEQSFVGIARSNRLKVLDVDLFSIGVINPDDASCVVYEHQDGNQYRRLITRDGVLKGAVLIGDTSFAGQIQEAIEANTALSNWPKLHQQFF
ncbi:MAG: FAD-dependent oxidoreductase [Deltaproteobacteria bacterium]|nr:FAD-dependent oxidoreductase [Deltaproteobacteria bacterium]MBN2670783.1 FAD-dependent oxidoreductase [Deltaproteobacteria bacterium]